MAIVQSVLDDDLYKLSQQQAVFQLYPNAKAGYRFVNRGGTKFPDGFAEQLRDQIVDLSAMSLSLEEEDFLRKIYFLRPTFVDFLRGFRFNPNQVNIEQNGGDLEVEVEGPWYEAIRWEVPLMAMISELYFRPENSWGNMDRFRRNTASKAGAFKELGVRFSEFGTRRRFSYTTQYDALEIFKQQAPETLIGTSNIHFARIFNLLPTGTQAHEWYMAHAAMFGYVMANRMGMKRWVDVYEGDLGIALTDTFTTDNFLKSFNKFYARLFDGVRQDSGNPFMFIDKIYQHYQNLRIDPTTKLCVFSNGIDSVSTIYEMLKKCKGRIRPGFGIGTWITNDAGPKPLNIVIKMNKFKCEDNSEWKTTVKLSDDIGKNTGDCLEIERAKRELCIMH